MHKLIKRSITIVTTTIRKFSWYETADGQLHSPKAQEGKALSAGRTDPEEVASKGQRIESTYSPKPSFTKEKKHD